MSRAKAEAERNALDFYATPDALARAICDRLSLSWQPGLIVEPSAGSGAFVRAARETWPKAEIMAVDIDPEKLPGMSEADAALVSDWLGIAAVPHHPDGYTLIVGNPPYRQAEEHVTHALGLMREGDALAFLLRLNFLGSAARVPFWDRGELATVATIVPRPSFTNGGTDGTEYALFVWVKGYRERPRIMPHLVWAAPRARKGTD